ncbi:oxidoreductase [Mycobacterium kubicae]|uniref:Oxidoreductase n=1 Tax=Mycobacterium kubicae TaxID=120959 RepID=A0AAX1J9J9_9MYCO|nr:SDR family oxidoreductase [Mycobacterium kubicae]MCV7094236.1 SDR family oxidoreductase [Mycobacterium kubicae]OBF23274.1 short-chain dehydrogenase [Mycobacterium kubicae]ORV98996.1 short-chain dehydrogenase [Mycobacterium kubicae]QNI09952.1 SDR family oxidoreductase [Mycobacterium kubicae]QPI38151.1 SDR family oxidoreductase [Mycobacterium kubicae]
MTESPVPTTSAPHLISGRPLAGRVAVVTGASSGIGEATAARLAELGASVALVARRGDRLDALQERIAAAGGHALALPTDVRDRSSVLATAERVAGDLGVVDLVFANAGIQLISSITDLAVDDWDTQVTTNVGGVMNAIQAFVRPLREAASHGRPADLITTSSIAAVRILDRFQVYSATKAYITQLSRLLRTELGKEKIRVSTIEPGMVDTELPDHVTDPSATKLMADLIEQIDVLRSEDIAELVAFIAALPKHVNLAEVIVLPTEQAI